MPVGVYNRPSPVDRFWAQVQKQDNGCWLWTGRLEKNGYGRFNVKGKMVLLHRFSFELNKGAIPEGLQLDHICRNRGCVNPDHLEAVTAQENVRRGLLPSLTRMRNASITHCPQGHPYDNVNTYIIPGTKTRRCRICRRETKRRWKMSKYGHW